MAPSCPSNTFQCGLLSWSIVPLSPQAPTGDRAQWEWWLPSFSPSATSPRALRVCAGPRPGAAPPTRRPALGSMAAAPRMSTRVLLEVTGPSVSSAPRQRQRLTEPSEPGPCPSLMEKVGSGEGRFPGRQRRSQAFYPAGPSGSPCT